MLLDVVTPRQKLVENVETDSLKLPSIKGELEILPGHTELLTLLAPGIMSYRCGQQEKRFAISFGFAEVRHNKIVVLAETCEESNMIDLERAKRAQKKSEDILNGVLTEDQFNKYQLKLQRSIIRQQVLK